MTDAVTASAAGGAAGPAAATARPAVRTVARYDAILLAGFGGPEGPDDVMPFLRTVTRGRGVPDERLADVAQHYLALGGRSPINEHNRALRRELDEELRRRGHDVPVLWGNRNWQPYLADAVRRADRAGHSSLLGVATSAYSSYSSCRQYREDFAAALIAADAVGRVRIDKVRPYYDLPGFLAPFTDGLSAAVTEARANGLGPQDLAVVFTTHSIPAAMADASGTDSDGALYVTQHLAACAAVTAAAGERLGVGLDWQLAYQSRSGPARIPWLEPDVNDVIAGAATSGARGVIVVPIGFVSDHVEVIWDLDTEARSTAAQHALWFRRVATPGTDHRFVAGLADLIVERLCGGAPVAPATTLRPRPDSCPAGCCRPRTPRPTTAGDDSAADWSCGGKGVDAAALAASGIAGAVPA